MVPGILIQLTTVGKNPIDFQNHPSLRTKIHSDQDLPLDRPLTDAHVGRAFVSGLRNIEPGKQKQIWCENLMDG